MKCKCFLAAAALAAVSLTVSGCTEKSFKNAYDMNTMHLADFDAGSPFYAEGFASGLCVPGNYEKLNTDGVDAEAFALFSLNDGEVISQQNIYERVYPASTTKILTCLIALEMGDLTDTVTVPDSAAIKVSGSSMANLKPGDKLSLSDLLYGLMVPSGNDAAEAIAVHFGGSDEGFAELMNEKARSLGATQSHFTNPHGLPDPNHYTTAYDMYLIFNAAMQNPSFREIASKRSHEARVTDASGDTRTVRWDSSNQYLTGNYTLPSGISYTGGKTGHTADAGYCLVMAETADDGKNYISVVYKAGSYQKLYDGMTALLAKSRN
ncbi:MAG: D-alanyl-D-alanine carboxypeptidase family protein [Eubacteriales bacterium]|nr:D-alanyl-D-alanine carboxypeptidase family protein [Eubacteriales bacterium]